MNAVLPSPNWYKDGILKSYKNYLIYASRNTIIITDFAFNLIRIFKAHQFKVESISVNEETGILVSIGRDQKVKLWDLKLILNNMDIQSRFKSVQPIFIYQLHEVINYDYF